ncbi:MAG: hypothetical protein KKB62_00580, partial [Nanoarchaeota archaeon]|nr:hypothetical protein [Nanoarchaeota archaeon]
MIAFKGFVLTKLKAERFDQKIEDIKVETSVNIISIEEHVSNKEDSGKKHLVISFDYKIQYSEKVAEIEIGGKIFLAVDPDTSSEVLKKWKKKELTNEFKLAVFNLILMKGNIKAVQV